MIKISNPLQSKLIEHCKAVSKASMKKKQLEFWSKVTLDQICAMTDEEYEAYRRYVTKKRKAAKK